MIFTEKGISTKSVIPLNSTIDLGPLKPVHVLTTSSLPEKLFIIHMQRILRNSLCEEGWKLFTGLYIAMPRERLRLYILSWMSLCKIFRKLTVSVKAFKLSSLVKYYFNTNTLIGNINVYGLFFSYPLLKDFI